MESSDGEAVQKVDDAVIYLNMEALCHFQGLLGYLVAILTRCARQAVRADVSSSIWRSFPGWMTFTALSF